MEKINGANYVPDKLYRLIDQADREPTNFSDSGQENHWRWVCIGVIGNGNASSVIGVFQVSGEGRMRTVKAHVVKEYEAAIAPSRFAKSIYELTTGGKYPDCIIAIDGDGVGATTADVLAEKYGLSVERIHWGRTVPNAVDKERYLNQRAYANVAAKRSLEDGRLQLCHNPKAIEQASHVHYGINDDGQLFITPKKDMLTSVEHWDICCFAQLVDLND